MVCILCNGKTQVINSRPLKRSNQVWRRRECLDCKTIFTTGETADYSAVWSIVSPDGATTAFSRDKLLVSIYKSLQHRSTALQDAGGLTDTTIHKLRQLNVGSSLTTKQITQIVLVALQRFDSTASTHYAAFHK